MMRRSFLMHSILLTREIGKQEFRLGFLAGGWCAKSSLGRAGVQARESV